MKIGLLQLQKVQELHCNFHSQCKVLETGEWAVDTLGDQSISYSSYHSHLAATDHFLWVLASANWANSFKVATDWRLQTLESVVWASNSDIYLQVQLPLYGLD